MIIAGGEFTEKLGRIYKAMSYHLVNGSLLFSLYFLVLSAGTAMGAECPISAEAVQEDVSTPDHIIGNGTSESCTSAAFVAAVAEGGIITFNCGPAPVTIILAETAKVFNNTGPQIVIDGGNLVTLSGGGVRRILYMNTCDQAQFWTTDHCQNQDHPQLTVQNLTFVDGNAVGEEYPGGGAIFVRGGRFKILHCRFVRNQCDETGPDVGGAAVRVLSQYETLPVYVVDSVFGGAAGDGNFCSNGGGLSSIGVSFNVINSLFSHNEAKGNGGNPAQEGTPGGGSGGAIYNDGNTYHLKVCGTAMHDNNVNEYGGAIFFVTNNHTGTLTVESSGLWNNPGKWEPFGYSGISGHADTTVSFSNIINSEEPIEKYTTIDVDGDEHIGLAEMQHALETIANGETSEISAYGRKLGDIDYNHELDLSDVIAGLRLLTGN